MADISTHHTQHLHQAKTAYRARRAHVALCLSLAEGLDIGQWRTSGRRINGKRPPRKATGKRKHAARCLARDGVANAWVATCGPAIGRLRANFYRYLSPCSPTARPTRPAFLHIKPPPKPSSVVYESPYEIPV